MSEFRRLLFHAVRLKPDGSALEWNTRDGSHWICGLRESGCQYAQTLTEGRSGEEALRKLVLYLCDGNADHFEALGPEPEGWGHV